MQQTPNNKIREALLSAFPCTNDQYFTLSVPSATIDIKYGGSFLPLKAPAAKDELNEIRINEILPVEKISPSPTKKSVLRSYVSALDMLVPRQTNIPTTDPVLGPVDSSKSKYEQAMKFLQSKDPTVAPERPKPNDRDLHRAKQRAQEQGIQSSAIDKYVQKQAAWSEARAKWEDLRSQDLETRDAGSRSAMVESMRQKELKRAQAEIHERWMDWVVNGDKFRVDYCFAVVDQDSIMARVENAKQTARDALLTNNDGDEFARVSLDPENWAQECQNRAIGWTARSDNSTTYSLENPEVWKKISCTIESNLDAPIMDTSNLSFNDLIASCAVITTFSAMLVTINRPWLHSEMFQDVEVDVPGDVVLSPGATRTKDLLEIEALKEDKNFGKFPAYPSAFVVAADITLEFKHPRFSGQDMVNTITTENIRVTYGPWEFTSGNDHSAQKIDTEERSLRISLQAPQIIGWISDILPQLPIAEDEKTTFSYAYPS